MRRLGYLVSAKRKSEQGEGFVKFCVKSMCVRWELERALDDVFGI